MASTSIEQALEVYLNAQSDLTNLIGGQRVWFMDAPSGTSGEIAPFITYFVVSADNSARTLCLKEAGDFRVQFDIWGSASESSNVGRFTILEVGKKLIDILRFYHTTMDGVTVDIIRPDGVRIMLDDEDDSLYHGIVEADIQYIEP